MSVVTTYPDGNWTVTYPNNNNPEWESALRDAHFKGFHGQDVSGYWKEVGCVYCWAERTRQDIQ